jgi:superfamily II DNA or RNA helicase
LESSRPIDEKEALGPPFEINPSVVGPGEVLTNQYRLIQVMTVVEFDRGTLLIRELPSAERTDLPVRWDPRVQAHRARALDYRELQARLRESSSTLEDRVPPPGMAEARPAPWKHLELRPYQEAALHAWNAASRRGVVVLPTGSGKTRLALSAMAASGLRTLCFVPTRALLAQWHEVVSRAYGGEVGRLGDSEWRLAPVTIATFESAYRQMPRIGNRFELLVVDEAHHFGAGFRDEALEMAIAPFRLGLTATPPTVPDQKARLSELIGPTVFELSVGDLAGSYLAPFDLMKLFVDLTPEERRSYEGWRALYREPFFEFQRLHPGASWESFLRTASRSEAGRRAIASWSRARRLLSYPEGKRSLLGSLLERHRASRVMVFVGDNETAYRVAREFLVMPLTCDIGKRERTSVLERFREGSLRALVSARVLNEGIDVPDAEVAIVVAGRLGGREHIQRVGRVLRPTERKSALVYELLVRGTAEIGRSARRLEGLIGVRAGAV